MSILEKRELLGVERGIKKGIEQGIEQGMQKGIKEVAKNLLKEGTEIALVLKATGLPKSEVEKLKNELDN